MKISTMKSINKIILGLVFFSAVSLIPGMVKAEVSAISCHHSVLVPQVGSTASYVTYYVGSVDGLDDIGCDETPIDVTFSGDDNICFTPNPGFKISNWAATEDDERTVCTTFKTDISPSINWTGDGKDYTVLYSYSPSSPSGIGSASPAPFCKGGDYIQTKCSVSDGYKDTYEVAICPFSVNGYICPGYDQNLSSFPQFPKDSSLEVVFREKASPSVTIKGVDLIRGGGEQVDEMSVPYPTSEQNNVSVRWYTENVTSCSCVTSDREICTPLSGTTYSTFIGESITAKDSPFSLTSGKTFTVTCD
jgi:hypothetical protein